MKNTIRELFVRSVAVPEEDIDLPWAALLIAKEEYARMNPNIYIAQLEAVAEDIADSFSDLHKPTKAIEALNIHLFKTLGYSGNHLDYYDPRNSFLSDVMDRKLGIPITLSLIYMEVSKRIGLPLVGVGMPGHFLLTLASSKQDWYIDPFNGGTILDTHDCAERLNSLSQGNVEFRQDFLTTVNKRQILFRMLANLKGVYSSQGDPVKTLTAIDRMLVLDPYSRDQIRDRGIILSRLQRFGEAVTSLQRYIELAPDAPDTDSVKDTIDSIWQRMAGLN